MIVVQATSGAGTRVRTATQTITVTVTDVGGEAPGKPAAPDVSAASATRLSVSWSVPANAGPAITDYDYRHRTSPAGSWTAVTGTTSTALSATITGLAEGTSYDVQVRATNDEGTGDWSDSGTESTDANAAPSFDSRQPQRRREPDGGGHGAGVGQRHGDDITGYAITGGADQAFFSIGATSGALTFDAAPNFEDAKDIVSVDPANAAGNNQYVVVVTATSGAVEREKTATQTITVTVTDVDTEAPGKPAAPTVSAASATSLTVTWSAPANDGPAITGLRLPPPDVAGRELDGGHGHGDHGAVGDDHGPGGRHVLRRAGAGHQRRGHRRLVGLWHGVDGRQRGAVVRLFGNLQRRREPDGGGHGAGVGQRHGRRHHRLRDHRRRGPGVLLDRPRPPAR